MDGKLNVFSANYLKEVKITGYLRFIRIIIFPQFMFQYMKDYSIFSEALHVPRSMFYVYMNIF